MPENPTNPDALEQEFETLAAQHRAGMLSAADQARLHHLAGQLGARRQPAAADFHQVGGRPAQEDYHSVGGPQPPDPQR